MSEPEAIRTPTVARVGSLCSGYGGLDMGLALSLGTTLRHAWHVENDPAPSKILAARFPGVPNYGDLKTLDYALMEPVDILTAGYPCQPFSDAGLRKGADDPRHLWPYVADAIGHLRPGLVLLENVRGHVRRGLDSVLADLAALGYDASWGVVRASEAGAPHRRERIFILAQDAHGATRGERWLAAPGQASGGWARPDASRRGGVVATDAPGARCGTGEDVRAGGGHEGAHGRGSAKPQRGGGERVDGSCCPPRGRRQGWTEHARLIGGSDAAERSPHAWGAYEPAIRRWESVTGRAAPWATEPRGRGGAERLSPAFVEWMMGLPAGWVTDVPDLSANEQLKALGNGVVPQQAALALDTLMAVSFAEAA